MALATCSFRGSLPGLSRASKAVQGPLKDGLDDEGHWTGHQGPAMFVWC